MTIDQMRYFVAVCETLNLTKAAEKLFVDHSSVSRGITALERELNVKLMERTRHCVELTQAGRLLCSRLTGILRQIDRLPGEVQSVVDTNILKVGVAYGLHPGLCPALEQFSVRFPAVTLNYFRANPWELLSGLQRRQYDCCLAFSSVEVISAVKTNQFQAFGVGRGRYKLFMSASHPLCQSSTLTLDEIKGHPDFISNDVLGLLQSQGQPRHIIKGQLKNQVAFLDDIIFKVKTAHAIVLLPEHMYDAFGSGCIALDVDGPLPEYEVSIYCLRANRGRVLSELRTFLTGKG